MSEAAPRRFPALPPRGLCRADAAAYVGVGVTKFDQMVERGLMPKPIRIDGRVMWDRVAVDRAFDALSDQADAEAQPGMPDEAGRWSVNP